MAQKPVNYAPNKRRENKKGKEDDREPSLPASSQPVLWVYGKDMADQIQMFLNISISFQAIQTPERPDQPDRVCVGFAHTDAVQSVLNGPVGTSAGLSGAPQREGGFGWASTSSLGRRLCVNLAFQAHFKEVPNICTSH